MRNREDILFEMLKNEPLRTDGILTNYEKLAEMSLRLGGDSHQQWTVLCARFGDKFDAMEIQTAANLLYFIDLAQLNYQHIGSKWKEQGTLQSGDSHIVEIKSYVLPAMQLGHKPVYTPNEILAETVVRNIYPVEWSDAIVPFDSRVVATVFEEQFHGGQLTLERLCSHLQRYTPNQTQRVMNSLQKMLPESEYRNVQKKLERPSPYQSPRYVTRVPSDLRIKIAA